MMYFSFFFSSRRRHTRSKRDWSSDVCSSDLSFERLRGREPAADRQGIDDDAEEGHCEDVPAERELVARAVEAEQRDRARSEERRVGKECRWRGGACEEREKEEERGAV